MGNLKVITIEGKPACSECFKKIGTEFKRNKQNEIMCPHCDAPLCPKAFDEEKNETLK